MILHSDAAPCPIRHAVNIETSLSYPVNANKTSKRRVLWRNFSTRVSEPDSLKCMTVDPTRLKTAPRVFKRRVIKANKALKLTLSPNPCDPVCPSRRDIISSARFILNPSGAKGDVLEN
jgi:hypothetical protein